MRVSFLSGGSYGRYMRHVLTVIAVVVFMTGACGVAAGGADPLYNENNLEVIVGLETTEEFYITHPTSDNTTYDVIMDVEGNASEYVTLEKTETVLDPGEDERVSFTINSYHKSTGNVLNAEDEVNGKINVTFVPQTSSSGGSSATYQPSPDLPLNIEAVRPPSGGSVYLFSLPLYGPVGWEELLTLLILLVISGGSVYWIYRDKEGFPDIPYVSEDEEYIET